VSLVFCHFGAPTGLLPARRSSARSVRVVSATLASFFFAAAGRRCASTARPYAPRLCSATAPPTSTHPRALATHTFPESASQAHDAHADSSGLGTWENAEDQPRATRPREQQRAALTPPAAAKKKKKKTGRRRRPAPPRSHAAISPFTATPHAHHGLEPESLMAPVSCNRRARAGTTVGLECGAVYQCALPLCADSRGRRPP